MDRKQFRTRQQFCKGCEHFGDHERSGINRTGCGQLAKPCDVELLWLSPKSEWCPIGRHAELTSEVEAEHTYKDLVTPPTSWQTDITPTADRAIVTFAVGRKAEEIASYTVPQMQRYADRVGAELVVIRDDQFPAFRIGNKFRLAEIGWLFERTLFVDMDVWITDRTPNLFTLSSGRVWMHPDREQLNNFSWLDHDAEMLARTQQVKHEADSLQCFNTGVVLFDREHAGIWQAPMRPFVGTHTAEQTWVEMQARRLGVPIGRLPLRYNLQWWMRDRWGKSPAFIHHLANAPHEERVAWLRERAAVQV